MELIFLGYDPGGLGANGAAVLRVPDAGMPDARVATFDSVDEVLHWFRGIAGETNVDGAGIDTMLSWSTVRSGWRPMDEHLRKTYPRVQHSIFSSNSAAGSMAIQGMAMAFRLKQAWPNIKLNETHPKVLYYALAHQPYKFAEPMMEWLHNMINATNPPAIANDHEWDALLSAWATCQGFRGTWTTDLMSGVQRLLLPAGPVTYFWP